MASTIFENLPGQSAWVGSFHGRLVEGGFWDKGEFWKLHRALVDAAIMSRSLDAIDRELALAVARIQSRVMGLVAAHYDSNDVFVISNLAPDELHAFIERFEHAVLGVFSGEVLAESSFDLANPLIGTD